MKNIHYPTLADTVKTILKVKNSHDAEHSENVSKLCVRIGELMSRFNEHEMEMLKWGAFLHDCGKMFLNDTLLNYPRKITAVERRLMETHVVLGRDFVTSLECDPIIIDIVHHHHFNEDNSGYPRSKSNPTIFARIVRVVDTFDAMTSHRVYRSPSTPAEVLMLLDAESGKIYNAEAVLFLRLALADMDREEEENNTEAPDVHGK